MERSGALPPRRRARLRLRWPAPSQSRCSQARACVQAWLVLVPHAPTPEDRLEPAIAHRLPQDLIDPIAELVIARRKDTNVVADAERRLLIREPGVARNAALGQHVVEHHGVHPAERKIAVRVNIVFIGDRDDSVLACAATSMS